MIQADRRDYRTAFNKHLNAYNNWNDQCGKNGKRLLLTYCVECGLKYLFMEKLRLYKVSDAHDDDAKKLSSHDFHILLREVQMAGGYSFKQITTKHQDIVDAGSFHELCRYCIEVEKDSIPIVDSYENQLKQIADEIKERV